MRLSQYLSVTETPVKDFALKVGVTPEAVRLYLAGKRTPRPAIMRAIREATSGAVEPNDFLPAEPQSEAVA